MTLQMANYYKHALSLAALSEEAVALQCLNRPACSCSVHRFKYENAGRVRLLASVGVWARTVQGRCIHVPACLFAILESQRTRAVRDLLVLALVVKVFLFGRSLSQLLVEWQLIWVPVCQDGRAESLFLPVDLFQQTPNTTASLSLHLWGWWGLPASTWVWDGNKRENKHCSDWIFEVRIYVLCNFSPHMHLRDLSSIICWIQPKSPGRPVTV